MKYRSIFAVTALAVAAGTSAFAIEGEQLETWDSSSVSREAVRADLRDLRDIHAWEPVTEASPSPLQAAEWDRKIAQLQDAQVAALAEATFVDEVALVDEAALTDGSSLPFDHPAIQPRASDGE
jgi:hypothetical protein